VDDFLSKKGLQEKLKSKRADLLIHDDVTILIVDFGFNKFLFQLQVFECQRIHSITCRITANDLNILAFSMCCA
jgi:hypothetical protein